MQTIRFNADVGEGMLGFRLCRQQAHNGWSESSRLRMDDRKVAFIARLHGGIKAREAVTLHGDCVLS